VLARIRGLAVVLLASLALSCGGAYAAAIARGDNFASSGMWDEAAAAYEEAMRIDPNDPEAAIKLKEARHSQAADRLKRAEALEKRGELVSALGLVQEAAKFDPNNTDAQRALTRINDAALDRAEQLVADGKEKEAFELTSLVVKGSPHDPRARKLDDKVRGVLADKAHERAKAFLDGKKLGNALVELASCLVYRPDYPDAKLEFGQVKLKLEDELRYYVVLKNLDATGKNAPVGHAFKPELLAQAMDEKLLLRVVKDKAPDNTQGVAVHGSFDGYDFKHDQDRNQRSCDYVCGTESKPNPQRAVVEQELASKERDLSQAEEEIGRLQKDVTRYEQDVARAQQEVDRKQQDMDKARADLDRCRASAQPGNSSACSSEESRVSSAQSSLDSARSSLSGPQNSLQNARSQIASAQDRRENSRRTRDEKTQQLRSTPEMITVDKFCPFTYPVDIHHQAAQVTLKLTLDRLGQDKPIVSDQPFHYDSAAQDETFPAHPGRCPQVAAGDPLQLPSEEQMRQDLVTKVVKDLRTKIVASYDAYRGGFLAEARRAEAAGLGEEATEAYVRYVLTGPNSLQQKEQIAAFFAKAKGLTKLDALWKL
jgi:tetratricopeptide (TPR) repeat protein